MLGANKPKVNTSTLQGFKAVTLEGEWNEISHTRGKRLGGCDNVKIIYSKTEKPNTFGVRQICYLSSQRKVATGLIYYPNESDQSKMKIRFDGIKGAISGENDYWVYAAKDDWMVISNPQGYVWVLSKKESISPCVYVDTILPAVKAAGLDITTLAVNPNVFSPCGKK